MMKKIVKNTSWKVLIELYRTMVRIRSCEESFVQPILRKEIIGPVHLYSGEEAIAAGVCSNLTKEDYIFGTHRSHGHFLAKGGSMNELIAEVYCKETGCSKGRGGSMHLTLPNKGMMGAVPIVAGTISLALGAALAIKIRKNKRVVVSFFGDGATGEGVLYESLNFAALKKLPLIFACENNFYSTHLTLKECRHETDISKIGYSFGVPSYKVDGNDVLAVYKTVKSAVSACRKGKGPVFIEFSTYRLRGHVGPDDNIQGSHRDIRPAKEIAQWRKKDPIVRMEKILLKNKMYSKREIDTIKSDILKEVQAAHRFAKESSFPKPENLKKYVFKD
jgi:TPP-dependent pyruvate/acetoin dehydrogenase alpha subunit